MTDLLLAPTSTTYTADRLSASFHRTPPSDTRYVAITRVPHPPVNNVSQTGCSFVFPPISDIYLVDDIKCLMKLRMVTKTRPWDIPYQGTLVGPVNNVMQSMISQVRIHINNHPRKSPFFTMPVSYYCHCHLLFFLTIICFLLLQCKISQRTTNTSVI
jgi:hypothetical protein